MKKIEIIAQIGLMIPDFLQKLIYKILYFMWKGKYSRILKFNSKKNTNIKRNLIVIDNKGVVGDFFILLSKLKRINFEKSEYEYWIYCNKKFKDFIDNNITIKNVNFIFSKLDFGNHINKKISNNFENEKEILFSIKSLFENNNEWNNIYFCCNKLDLVHYSILFFNDYNKAFTLKNFLNKKKPRIINQNIPLPSLKLWIYFFNFYKKLKIEIWGKRNYYFGDMIFDLIYENDNKLSLYEEDEKKRYDENNYISFMYIGSNYTKTLTKNYVEKFLDFFSDYEIKILGKSSDNSENISIKSSKHNNLINKTNIIDYIKISSESKFIITTDTSLAHIGYFFGIFSVVLFNKSIKKINDHINFWFPEKMKENILIADKKIFMSEKNVNWASLYKEINEEILSKIRKIY